MLSKLGKLVVYGVPRSGSNYFISMLNKHPEILCHFELFHDKEIFDGFWTKNLKNNLSSLSLEKRDKDPKIFLKKFYLQHYGHKYIGFNIFPKQNLNILKHTVQDNEFRKIILKRKSTLRSFVSLKIAQKTGIWSIRSSKKNKNENIDKRIYFRPKEYIQYVNFINNFYKNLENNIIIKGGDFLVIYFEDFLNSTSEISQIIFNYLGVEKIFLEKNKSKFNKQNSENLSNLIINYTDFLEFAKSSYVNFSLI